MNEKEQIMSIAKKCAKALAPLPFYQQLAILEGLIVAFSVDYLKSSYSTYLARKK